MGKIRRGGYVFITWVGDHPPRHVHVYRDGKLVVKWDLENRVAMNGHATPRPACDACSTNSKRKVDYEDQARHCQ